MQIINIKYNPVLRSFDLSDLTILCSNITLVLWSNNLVLLSVKLQPPQDSCSKQQPPRDESEGWVGEWMRVTRLGEGRLRKNESESERGKGQRGGVTLWGEREAKRGCGAVKLSEAVTVRGAFAGEGGWPAVRAWERERGQLRKMKSERKIKYLYY